jgi:hypothetical protein
MIICKAPHKRAAMLKHPHAYRIVSQGDDWIVFYCEKKYFEYVHAIRNENARFLDESGERFPRRN